MNINVNATHDIWYLISDYADAEMGDLFETVAEIYQ